MLLVAMLALGTATFAWFTNSTTARAQNAKVSVSAPSGLVIAAVTHGANAPAASAYGSTISLESLTSGAMTPSSTDAVIDSGKTEPDFFAAQVNNEKKVESVAASNTYKAIDIYGKLSSSNKGSGSTEIAKAVNLAAINYTASNTNKAGTIVRCAYFKAADNTRLAYFHLGGNTARSVYPVTAAGSGTLADADNNYSLVNTESYVSSTALATAAYGSSTATGSAQYDVGTLLGTVYFWVEGQDADCKNSNITSDVNTVVGQTAPLEFEFTLGDDIT